MSWYEMIWAGADDTNEHNKLYLFHIYYIQKALNHDLLANEHCIKMKFSIKDFFSKCDQIRIFLRIWSHLLKKSLMANFTVLQWAFYLCNTDKWFTIRYWNIAYQVYLSADHGSLKRSGEGYLNNCSLLVTFLRN